MFCWQYYGGGEYLHCFPLWAVITFVASGWHQMEASGFMINSVTVCTGQPRKHLACDHHSSSRLGFMCRSDPQICLLPRQGRCSVVNKFALSISSFHHQPFLEPPALLPQSTSALCIEYKLIENWSSLWNQSSLSFSISSNFCFGFNSELLSGVGTHDSRSELHCLLV